VKPLVPFLATAALAGLFPARAQIPDGARYVIIAPDSLAGAVQPLADWKTRKGALARVVPLSIAGSTPEQVRSFVRNAWNTWPLRPEYLLLACSPTQLPGYAYDDDSYYGDMTGDYRMEIAVGRLPAQNRRELAMMVARCLAYERRPDSSDTAWYSKGTTVVSDDDTFFPDPYYLPDSRYARQLWLDAGYTVAESLYNLAGDSTDQLVAALNDGRTFITYRGVAGGFWWNPFNTFVPDYTWHNRGRTPIIISATCETITLRPGEDELGNLCMRFGTEESLGGTVAFFGTSQSGTSISAPRSACYRGFFSAVFEESVSSLGQATLRARARVDSLFHDHDRYVEWCLLGDPDLSIWTAPPRPIDVRHDTVIQLSEPELVVAVASAGRPVQYAVACAWMDTSVYALDTTDSSGLATLNVDAALTGTMQITVTGRDLRPYEGTCRIASAGGAFVTHLKHVIADPPPRGNGDSCAAPGESVAMPLWVMNRGDSAAAAVTSLLSTTDTLATITDSARSFGDLAPGDSAYTGDDGFRLSISSRCPEGRTIMLNLRCASGARVWDSHVYLPVGTPDILLTDTSIIETAGNGNGRFDPGETARFIVSLFNDGQGTAGHVRGILRSYDSRLVVTDSLAGFGSIKKQAGVSNDSDRFEVCAGRMMPETEIPCSLFVTSAGHAWTFGFNVIVGLMNVRDPIPDGPRIPPLYWGYDDVDTGYAEHPAYSWVELRNAGTRLDLGDNQTVQLDLPRWFGGFRYYGRRYAQFSVNANGWVAPGFTTYTGWNNRRLPSPLGTPLMAVNWDDLYPPMGGGIWYAFDSAAHRLTVEWDSVHYRSPSTRFDKFEVLLHDSTHAATDGNNEFSYQYRYNHNMKHSTVGMQDSSGLVGMTLLHDSVYHRAVAYISGGRAIRFTTDPPMVGIEEGRTTLDARRFMLEAWPNPTRGIVKLRWNPGGPAARLPGDRAVGLTVCDVAGRTVLRSSPAIRNSTFALDLRSLSAGVYILRLTAGSQSATQKLVVQH
jgi:hypothetical protein